MKEFGWNPIVVTVGESKFPITDLTLNEDVPSDTEIIRINDVLFKKITDSIADQLMQYVKPAFDLIDNVSIKDEYMRSIELHMQSLRDLFLFPDGSTIWACNVVKELNKKVDFSSIDVVFTTANPNSTNIIGYYIKQQHNIPWVADFRDEWTNNAYYTLEASSIRFKMEQYMEERIVHYADKIVTTTPLSSENFREGFHLQTKKVETITNGYDEDDFINLEGAESMKFSIIHNGTFYLVRNPNTILKAIDDLIADGLMDKNLIEINFVGKSEKNIRDEVSNFDSNSVVQWFDYLPHKESIKKSLCANLLLLIVGPEERVKPIIPGKLFEYLRMRKPILGLSPRGSAVEFILNETGQGSNIEFNNIETIKMYILKMYNNWLYKKEVYIDGSKSIKYERRNLTQKLAQIFYEVCESHGKCNNSSL